MSIANRNKAKKKVDIVIIKKYANRRLYNMQESIYITISDVRQLVVDNINFMVIDAKDNTDLTRTVLLQIIMEAEQEGKPLFSADILSQFIRTYNHSMQEVATNYLEKQMQYIQQIQEDWSKQAKNVCSNSFNQDNFLSWITNNQQKYIEAGLNWHNKIIDQIQEQNPFLSFLHNYNKDNKF